MYINMLTEVVCLYILLYLGDTVCKQKDFKRSILGCVCVCVRVCVVLTDWWRVEKLFYCNMSFGGR